MKRDPTTIDKVVTELVSAIIQTATKQIKSKHRLDVLTECSDALKKQVKRVNEERDKVALRLAEGNVSTAAKLLGVPKHTMWSRVNRSKILQALTKKA